ncbi:MBL fold metallo-hydrolase RNA specificity domain-containing protein, partial [Oleiphilus sp. HI0123]
AAVHTISGYSAHAGQEDLLNFVQGMKAKPSEIRIVHGDDDAKKALKQALRELLGEGVGLSIP